MATRYDSADLAEWQGDADYENEQALRRSVFADYMEAYWDDFLPPYLYRREPKTLGGRKNHINLPACGVTFKVDRKFTGGGAADHDVTLLVGNLGFTTLDWREFVAILTADLAFYDYATGGNGEFNDWCDEAAYIGLSDSSGFD